MNKIKQDLLNASVLRKMGLLYWDSSQGVHMQLSERAQDSDPIFDLFAGSRKGPWSRETFIVWLGISYNYYLHHFCDGWYVIDGMGSVVGGNPGLSYGESVIVAAQHITK